MALVICPECNKKISQYAELCPECGFPLKKIMGENNLNDTSKIFMCPKCASYSAGGLSDIYIKCKYCNSTVIQLDLDDVELERELYKIYKTGDKEYDATFLKQYDNNQFSQEAYEHRRAMVVEENRKRDIERKQNSQSTQQQNIPRCPTCSSTNIKKISATSKAINAGLFGLLGNKRKKQFHCNDCGYEW